MLLAFFALMCFFGSNRTRLAMVVLIAAFYLPYGWLFESSHWSSYRLSWMAMYLELPALIPSHLLFRELSEFLARVAMVVFTFVMFLGAFLIGRHGGFWLWVTAVIVFALSSFNSLIEKRVVSDVMRLETIVHIALLISRCRR